MKKGEKRSTLKGKQSTRSIPWGSYDTVPQPQGEFRDMFRLMQDQKLASEENSGPSSESSKYGEVLNSILILAIQWSCQDGFP